MTFIYILVATIVISFGSIVGIVTFSVKEKTLNKILFSLVSLSAGTMIGGAFLHLIPEALEKLSVDKTFIVVILSFSIFFIIEKFLHWRHCHDAHCKVHTFGTMNLIGDGIHNFTDGLIIASTFMISSPLGISVSLAIALHEIPQEVSDLGVLLYSGYKKGRAVLLNFLVASTVILGGIVGFFLTSKIDQLTSDLLPFAAGGFIYLAASDLIPEIRGEKKFSKSIGNFLIFLAGNLLIYLLKFVE
jgi:zinc and cadmium transporter